MEAPEAEGGKSLQRKPDAVDTSVLDFDLQNFI